MLNDLLIGSSNCLRKARHRVATFQCVDMQKTNAMSLKTGLLLSLWGTRFLRLLCLLSLCTGAIAQSADKASSTAVSSFTDRQQLSARQSILFRVDEQELRVVRHIVNIAGEGARSASAGKINVMPVASVNAEATFNTVRGRSSISPNHPYVVWMNGDGDVIEVATFDDPRLLRSPQPGLRPHSAAFGQSSGHFLLRGPAVATAVHLHLPDRSILSSQLPTATDGVAESTQRSSGSAADAGSATDVSIYLAKRAWLVDLGEVTAK